MKCDELKQYEVFVSNPYNTGGSFREIAVLSANKVYEAIAELKAENKLLKEHIANGDVSRITWIDEVIELKAKLESVQASMYADVVDANMENRRLRRELWIARAYRGRDNSILLPSKFMRNVWEAVERKCRAKAEEYK